MRRKTNVEPAWMVWNSGERAVGYAARFWGTVVTEYSIRASWWCRAHEHCFEGVCYEVGFSTGCDVDDCGRSRGFCGQEGIGQKGHEGPAKQGRCRQGFGKGDLRQE